ncbi:MAG: RsmB/NOP family class I SAM-dependent RNA methyltransferase [bacterium]|nr:RsmB/NOP family class I SAM-dependent RNA methyltransferase [bacterium]
MDARLKSFPQEFLDLLPKIFPPGQLSNIYKSLLTPKPTTIRINTLKTTPDKILNIFRKNKIVFTKDGFLPNCFYLQGLSQKKLSGLACFQQGEIYLQNTSSQLPPHALNLQPGDLVLDLCASPGSKTTQMAALMKNKGHITALEPDKIRFDRLCHNTSLLGCENVTLKPLRAQAYYNSFSETAPPLFDKILVDVPCSGNGTFYINDRSGFRHYSDDFVCSKSKLQQKILTIALRLLKKGGLACYATCSLSPEENEIVLNNVLSKEKNIVVVPVEKFLKFPFVHPGLSKWNGCSFSKNISQNSLRIYPSSYHEGFFLSLLKKV